MPTAHRMALLVCGIALAALTFMMGATFTYLAESATRAAGSWMFWLFLGLLFAAPLWVPAVIPSRFVMTSRIVRWASAILVLVPLRYIASVVLHQYRLFGGGNFVPAIFGGALLLSVGCALAIVVLVLPEFRRKAVPAA